MFSTDLHICQHLVLAAAVAATFVWLLRHVVEAVQALGGGGGSDVHRLLLPIFLSGAYSVSRSQSEELTWLMKSGNDVALSAPASCYPSKPPGGFLCDLSECLSELRPQLSDDR